MDKKSWISIFNKAGTCDKFDEIVNQSVDKDVLDVGCVGQDKSYESELWLHARIKQKAKYILGVDIDIDSIEQLNSKGFEICSPDNLTDISQGKKFDLIVMGDVIEHVDNPVLFLQFYAQYLKDDGRMIICTPNVFGMRYSLQVLFFGRSGTNPEHTFGFEPYTMLELFQRSGLEPTEFSWLKEYSPATNYKQRIIRGISWLSIRFRKYFSANFMFIIGISQAQDNED